ncbi:MAG: acetate uptake transporter [Methanomassiliicoccales archaeon]|nr:acetate uptake transporter [Methanomassiliicoccales archaeon]MDD1755336.1 acetate uptake transporter [Methanomassiliicoccales archaeon]
MTDHEEVSIRSITIKDVTANPAPLGLMGFGMTTVLLNLHNAGAFGMSTAILALGIFFGGLAQIVAGMMEWKKGNTFGTTAFTSYGFFWLALVGLLILPELGIGEAADKTTMAWFLGLWGVFTAVLFIATLRMNRALQFVFASLAILFFTLALGDALNDPTITQIAGYIGIICGLSAMYAALAQVLNEVYGRQLAPLGQVKTSEKKKTTGGEMKSAGK